MPEGGIDIEHPPTRLAVGLALGVVVTSPALMVAVVALLASALMALEVRGGQK